ncbi:MAG: hypothetical protein ACREDO_00605 [Methyloceanibacter sp.]
MKIERRKQTRPRHCFAAWAVAGMALLPAAVTAESVKVEDLASNPQSYLGKEVELVGQCSKGGAGGDVLGYECTTEETVYVDARKVEPKSVKQKFDKDCVGKAASGSESCRAIIRFVPHSFTTSTKIESGKNVVVFNTDKAEASF